MDDGLELLVKPSSKTVSSTAAHRNDRADGPGSFVYLRHDVKVGEGVGDFERAIKVRLIFQAEGAGVVRDEVFYHLVCFSDGLSSLSTD